MGIPGITSPFNIYFELQWVTSWMNSFDSWFAMYMRTHLCVCTYIQKRFSFLNQISILPLCLRKSNSVCLWLLLLIVIHHNRTFALLRRRIYICTYVDTSFQQECIQCYLTIITIIHYHYYHNASASPPLSPILSIRRYSSYIRIHTYITIYL